MASKVNIGVEINVNDRNAQSKINKLKAGLASFSGMKLDIMPDLDKGDEAARRLSELMSKLSSIRKIGDKKVEIIDLNSLKNAGKIADEAFASATGAARQRIKSLRDDINETLNLFQGRVDNAVSSRAANAYLGSAKVRSKDANVGRAIRLSQIAEDLAIAQHTNNIRKQISLLNEKVKILQNIDKANRVSIENANPEIAQIREQIKALELKKATLKKVNEEKSKSKKETESATKALSVQQSMFNSLKSIVGRYFSLFTLWNIGERIAKVTGYFQQQQVALEGILGSATDAKKAIDQIKALALESPFQTKELVRYTKQLSAYGIESSKLVPTMKELADISAGLGVDMDRLILAYGQVKSAAVLRGQELRQFTEAGIPMVQALADKFTQLNGRLVTTGEVFKLISERKVPFEMVAEVLSDMTKEGGKFYQMQENLTDTLYGQIEKIKDMITLALNDAGSQIHNILMGVVKFIQGIIKHGQALLMGGFIMYIAHGVKTLVSSSSILGQSFRAARIEAHKVHVGIRFARLEMHKAAGAAGKFNAFLKGAAVTARAIGRLLASNVAIFAFSALTSLIYDSVNKANEFRDALREVDETFSKETRKQLDGLDKLITRLANAAKGTKEYNDALSTLKSNYGDFVSDAMIDSVEKNTLAWKDLQASIEGAIKAKAEYDKHVARVDKDAEMYMENANEQPGWLRSWVDDDTDIENLIDAWGKANYKELASRNIMYRPDRMSLDEYNSHKDKLNDIVNYSLQDFLASKGTKAEDLEKQFIDNIRKYLPELGEDLGKSLADAAFEQFKNSKYGEKYFGELAALDRDPYNRNQKVFDEAAEAIKNLQQNLWEGKQDDEYNNRSAKSKAYDPFAYNENIQKEYINALNKRFFEYANTILETTKIQFGEASEEYKKVSESLMATAKVFDQDFDAEKTSRLADAFHNLSENIQNPTLKNWIDNLTGIFVKLAGTRSEVSAQIASNIRKDFGEGIDQSGKMKDFFAKYERVNDQNFNSLRDQIVSDYQRLKSDVESHKATTGEWKKYIDDRKQEMKWLEMLASTRYFDVDLTQKKAGANKYERIRIVNFFDDVLAMITKAEDASKKVAGVTGWTESMYDFFASLSDDNYMKEFFKEGGKPFEKFFEKLGEYGVTEFLPKGFSAQNIETIFKNAGWEEGKEFSAPDFQRMYREVLTGVGQDVLGNLKKRAEQYEKGTSERNSLDAAIKSLEEFISRSEKNADMRWGGDEVQKKLDAAIKSLRDINTNVSQIREQRKYFDAVAGSSNYLRAQKLIYGNSNYETYSDVDTNVGLLRRLLGDKAGAGLASTAPGVALKKLLDSGKLNISNLGALLDLQTRLQRQAGTQYILDENGNPTDQEVDNNFKETLSFIIDGIKQLTDSLTEEFKALGELDSNITKNANSIVNATRKYVDAISLINKALDNGSIDKAQAAEKRIVALQNLYDSLSTGLPEWAKTFFSDSNSATGISKKGYTLMQAFGGKDMESKIKDEIARQYSEQMDNRTKQFNSDKDVLKKKFESGVLSEEDYNKLTESLEDGFSSDMQGFAANASSAMAGASGAIAMIDMIIKAVYGAIKGIIEMAEHTMQAAEAYNSLMLKKQKNGKYVDENGNIQVSGGYYSEQKQWESSRAALEMVGTYNQHVMDGWEKFKSGDFLGSFAEVYNSIADMVRDIAAYGDIQLRQQQDDLIRSNEKLSRALDTLNHTLQGEAGIRRWANMTQQIVNLEQQRSNSQELLSIENQKKSGDADKAQAYADEITNAERQIDDIIRGIQEEIFGTADELAKQLTDPLVDAFRNGQNAARAWRDAVRGYIGDVLKEVLMTKVIAPQIDNLLDQFMDGETDPSKILAKFSDATKAVELRNSLFALGDEMIEGFNNLPQAIQEMIAWNSSTSELSGGIQGITEDTARTLEGLSYSMLAQLVLIQRSTVAMETFAQMQVSRFDSVIALQKEIRNYTKNIGDAIEDMRIGTRPLHVLME